MALGRILGGGSSVNAMVWTRGMERDYDAWERHGATGWSFKDVLQTFKAQEDWKGGPNNWRGVDAAWSFDTRARQSIARRTAMELKPRSICPVE
jgi:choline dehydrogenase-like flavoprotein